MLNGATEDFLLVLPGAAPSMLQPEPVGAEARHRLEIQYAGKMALNIRPKRESGL